MTQLREKGVKMTKIKKILLLASIMLCLSGCFKKDDLDGANIITTVFPIEYLVNELYGENSTVESIYPHGIDTNDYELTNKQINNYSKNEMFIYNGLGDEKKLAATFLNKNKHLKIIDVSKGLSIKNEMDDLFISPSNYLMLAQNIKDGLNGYIKSTYMQEEINDNYEKLKVLLSGYDAEFRIMADNAEFKAIVVANNSLKFLENYGLEVISVFEDDRLTQDIVNRVKRLIKEKNVSYIFTTDGIETETLKKLKSDGAEIITIKSLNHLTEEEIDSNVTYEMLMNDNIEKIKAELYN